ncbi:hypothetical protein Hanom_Chr09g00783881 [Helianthus anomalus]
MYLKILTRFFFYIFRRYDWYREFVSCVRCIKILSPQEVQQMSLDGDFGGNNLVQNPTCSSSDV